MSVCKCSMSIKLTGSGCYTCNPEYWLEQAHDHVEELEAEIEQLKERLKVLQYAHEYTGGRQ